MDKEYFEVIVKRKQNDLRTRKILSAERIPALGKGENFMSSIDRYKLVVLLGSGETVLKHLIVKSLPETKEHSTFLQEYSFFKTEIHMYSKILRDMKALMEEFQDKRDTLWCEMLGYKPYHKLILQDLKDHQFGAVNRRENLDFAHTAFVLKAIARFHAMSAVLLKRCLIRPAEFEPYTFAKEKFSKFVFEPCISVMATAVKQSWGDEWSHLPDKLTKVVQNLYATMQELTKYDSNNFNVVNHGDLWTNNIMFKHVEDTNIPAAARFVDFQICHNNSFAWDIMYFMFSSIKPELRREKFDEILLIYYKALCDNLQFYNYPEQDVPTLEQVNAEMKRIKYFGMIALLSIYALTSTEAGESFDMDKNLNSTENPEAGVNIEVYLDKKFREAVKDDLNAFIKEGLL